MEDLDRVRKKLEDLENRVTHLESLILKGKSRSISQKRKVLNDHVLSLREERFFSDPRTAQETYEKVQKAYPCELNRVEVALLRLAGKKQLRKAKKIINGREYKAYVW
jgi:hypothetical protein